MKLAILSRNTKLYSTRRLVEAARDRGHTVRVLDPLRCYMRIASDGFHMHYKGRELRGIDAVIPRVGASVTRYGSAVLRQFELMGTWTPNPSDAVLRARDKLRSHQLLAAQGIGLPATVFGDNPDDTVDLLSMLGPPPHVIKLNEGSQGAGVMLTEKLSASRGVIEALRGLYAQFVVQEFIAEAKGADLRCFVVGDRVVAAMKRQAPKGDFRSNLHRGGQAKGVKPTAMEQETAIRAAQSLGLGVAGVDLIRSARGPLVLEVNASPGLEGIEEASGVDVAGAVVDYVSQSVATIMRSTRTKAQKSKLSVEDSILEENGRLSTPGASKRARRARRA
ncbi:30S ribosomal protein S6--L-glutamate ligase [Aerolutibacter daejeonensis]|uniref:30S ribosomal protein S6--L-glutamate ligase n=1 Tax=Aerolutibacter daejeonensis TaxID=346181 RepID=UPI0009FDE065|nr:30S ribosomal protein S6--L-glutamate ligase [Lysobacter daejeonensis]